MRIVVPQPPGMPEIASIALWQEGLDPVVHFVDGHDLYSFVIASEWRRGSFVLVEHDIVPWPGAVRQLWDCDEIWCGHTYPMGRAEHAASLGCVRFSDSLVKQFPDLPRLWVGKNWQSLDSHVIAAVWEATETTMHLHEPPVAHVRSTTR